MAYEISIRTFLPSDFPQVQEIYQQGIETKNATFETVAPDWEIWDKKFISHPRLVATHNNRLVGWAMLSRVSAREVYSGVCDVSIYIHNEFKEMGVGKKLLNELIIQSEQNNVWTLQAGIFPENIASINLHLKCGFRNVGYREKIGKMYYVLNHSEREYKWRDTILLERRSKKAGI